MPLKPLAKSKDPVRAYTQRRLRYFGTKKLPKPPVKSWRHSLIDKDGQRVVVYRANPRINPETGHVSEGILFWSGPKIQIVGDSYVKNFIPDIRGAEIPGASVGHTVPVFPTRRHYQYYEGKPAKVSSAPFADPKQPFMQAKVRYGGKEVLATLEITSLKVPESVETFKVFKLVTPDGKRHPFAIWNGLTPLVTKEQYRKYSSNPLFINHFTSLG